MNWWQRLWRRNQMEEQLDKELRFHLDQQTADLIAQGYAPQEARRQARLTFGGPEQVKEDCRDARGTRWLEDMWQDLRYAMRMLRRNPGFVAVAVLTLALGSGATTAMFTLINSVLLRPLPYPEPNRLVTLQEQTSWRNEYGNRWAFAYPNFLDCKKEIRSLDLMAWRFGGGTASERGNAEYVSGLQISPELFSVLKVNLLLGRAFLPEEDRPAAAPAIIISNALWQRRFGGDPAAVGMPLAFDGKSYTIVGITPANFRWNDDAPDVFTPLGQDPSPSMTRRDRHPGINVLARLKPGATPAEAEAELALISNRLAQQYPDSNAGRSFVFEPLRPDVGDAKSMLWLLLGAVSLVLLIACANVASLLLARAISREHELAMRVALGASRSRLVRQCLTESAVLGLCGGVLGVLLAAFGVRPFVAFWPGSLPRAEEVHLDWRVLLFAVGISLFSGFLFGLAPALRVRARELEQALRAGGRALAGSSRRLHGSFVISEVALAVVLLIAAGMLGRTLLQLSSLDPGVNVQNVLVARMALSPAAMADTGRIRAAWQEALDRAHRMPGVKSVALVDTVPMREGNNQIGYSSTPSLPPASQLPLALTTCITPDYFNVMGISLIKGRLFDDHDRQGKENVVVIDDVMAQQAFGAQEPVGKYLWIPSSPFSFGGNGPDPARVIGVVRHVRHWGLASDDQASVRAQLYYSFDQLADPYLRRWSDLMSITVRASVPPLSMVELLRKELRGAGSDQALYDVRTMEQLVSGSLARQRFLLLLFGIFAGLALLLACIGVYGVLAYLTGQRVPEFGVRMALGASTRNVMQLVLGQGLGIILAGVGVGTVAALAAGRLLQHLVDGMRPAGPATFALMISVLLGAGLVASFVPARRASRVDPMTALRQE